MVSGTEVRRTGWYGERIYEREARSHTLSISIAHRTRSEGGLTASGRVRHVHRRRRSRRVSRGVETTA